MPAFGVLVPMVVPERHEGLHRFDRAIPIAAVPKPVHRIQGVEQKMWAQLVLQRGQLDALSFLLDMLVLLVNS